MIDFEALFKVTYGLYIVSSGNKDKGNGFISNTVFQVTAEPPRFATCCNKDNYTAQFIRKTGAFAVSVLHSDTDSDIFQRFGYKSGENFNKLEGMKVKYGETGVPVVLNNAIAFLECKVTETFDVGTHLLFIGELNHSEMLDDSPEPMTYQHYRQVKKSFSPKNAPTYINPSKLGKKTGSTAFKKYRCTECGYIYDEEKEGKRFADLPSDWVCPVCGSPREDFEEI
ncbi:MAG: flavin reductase [Bacteroidales bacterium]|nr:flavin reductase [Bacteroidales bacterium]